MSLLKGFLIINGDKIFDSENAIRVINPATEEMIGEVPSAGKEHLFKVVKSAQESFSKWSREKPKTRSEILHKAAEKVREESEKISEILTYQSSWM